VPPGLIALLEMNPGAGVDGEQEPSILADLNPAGSGLIVGEWRRANRAQFTGEAR